MTLHNEQDAIKQVVQETAYRNTNPPNLWLSPDGIGNRNADILQDPTFWQALGKARGWAQEPNEICVGCAARNRDDCGCYWESDDFSEPGTQVEWLYHAHRYLDAKFAGDTQTYWQNLP